MTVIKVMFTAIVVSMLGLLYLALTGWMDLSAVYINPTFIWAQIIGGLILGVGFVVGGYCPGTSVVGATTGQIDAFVFLLGALFGMIVFGETFPLVENITKAGSMGSIKLPEFFHLSTGLVAFIIVVIAVGTFIAAERLESKFKEEAKNEN